MNITSKTEFNHFCIYFDTILHLKIRLDELIAFHSWSQGGVFYVEYICKTNSVKAEYDDKQKWLSVLKLLDDFEFS